MSKLKAYTFCAMERRGLADYYLKSEADKVIAEKDAEIARLKEDALNTDKAREKWLQLARKQAKEICRLKRALYKACVNWMTNRQCAMRCFDLEARAKNFDKAIAKCQAKMEKFK